MCPTRLYRSRDETTDFGVSGGGAALLFAHVRQPLSTPTPSRNATRKKDKEQDTSEAGGLVAGAERKTEAGRSRRTTLLIRSRSAMLLCARLGLRVESSPRFGPFFLFASADECGRTCCPRLVSPRRSAPEQGGVTRVVTARWVTNSPLSPVRPRHAVSMTRVVQRPTSARPWFGLVNPCPCFCSARRQGTRVDK